MTTERVVMVTGASSGIGRATAKVLAGEGTAVALVARDEERLQVLAREIEASGGRATVAAADVTDGAARERALDATLDRHGRLDGLVNAAGIIAAGDWEATDLDSFDRMMDVNVRAVLALTKGAIPHLVESRGSIVNVSSVTGTRAFPGVLSYCISKAALDQMTRCLALELGPQGVRVNAVNPGVIVTELHRRSGMDDETYAGFLERSKETHPIGRAGEADEVAHTIAFLLSSGASNITGATLPVDGGRQLTCLR